jgi:F-type H+-transporting ATPase subunit epsilon
MTEQGEITIMPHHEPIIAALKPGLMHVEYYVGHKVHENAYVIGGGVVSVSGDGVAIIADFVEREDNLTDVEYIESQKQEAERIVKDYRSENGATIDPHRLIEVEYELLKYTAMHQLALHYRDQPPGTRK